MLFVTGINLIAAELLSLEEEQDPNEATLRIDRAEKAMGHPIMKNVLLWGEYALKGMALLTTLGQWEKAQKLLKKWQESIPLAQSPQVFMADFLSRMKMDFHSEEK